MKVLHRDIPFCGACPMMVYEKGEFICKEIGHGGRPININMFKDVALWCPLPEKEEIKK